MPTSSAQAAIARRAVVARRIRFFVAATITYNVVEAVVAFTAGTRAWSSALIASPVGRPPAGDPVHVGGAAQGSDCHR